MPVSLAPRFGAAPAHRPEPEARADAAPAPAQDDCIPAHWPDTVTTDRFTPGQAAYLAAACPLTEAARRNLNHAYHDRNTQWIAWEKAYTYGVASRQNKQAQEGAHTVPPAWRKHGVTVALQPPNRDLARAIERALLTARQARLPLAGLSIRATPVADYYLLRDVPALFMQGTPVIYIGSRQVCATPGSQHVPPGLETQAVPPAQLHHAICHELVHFAHYQSDPSRYAGLQTDQFNARGRAMAARISPLAQSGPLEFVAEVGAGLLTQDPFYAHPENRAILAMYRALGGPLIAPPAPGRPSERLLSILEKSPPPKTPSLDILHILTALKKQFASPSPVS